MCVGDRFDDEKANGMTWGPEGRVLGELSGMGRGGARVGWFEGHVGMVGWFKTR